MKYALRKLIAFVFLLGLFWFVYRDVDNLWNPTFRQSVAGLVIVFAAFWLLVPLAVVWARIWRRTRKNRRGYAVWLKEIQPEGPRPHRRDRHLNIDASEDLWFHEKGTLYVENRPELNSVTVPGRIGDVAFPHEPRVWRKAQRVHCYFTSRRLLFLGKEIDLDLPFNEVAGFKATVGGLVFELKRDGKSSRAAFTFVNPLIAADILRRIMV